MVFQTVTVEQLCRDGVLAPPMDGNHGAIHPKTRDYVPSGIPFVMASDLRDGLVDTTNCAFISETQAATLRKGFAKTGDVLLSHKATIGRRAIVGELDTPYILLTPQITYYRILDETVLDRRYLYYYFGSYEFLSLFEQWAGAGSTRAYLGITGQKKLPIILPDIETQRSIANTAGSLDDKIELNRRMNETLERIAQAIFKDWFVDFGPTRRKLEGRTDPVAILGGLLSDPKEATPIAALFPAAFGEDGLPEGWTAEALIDQANWVNGAAYKNMHFSEAADALPVVKIAELKSGITANTKRTATELGDKYRITNGELLFSWSGNPDTSIDTFIWHGGDAWLNQHIFAVRSEGKRSAVFLYTLLRLLKPKFTEIARNKQTTGLGHVTKQDMSRIRVCVGTPELLTAFDQIAGPLHDRLRLALAENVTLAHARDLLLPKLMSGGFNLSGTEPANAEASL